MKDVKIIYYVDTADNYKSSIIAFDANKNLKSMDVIEQIGKTLEEHGFGKRGVCNSIAWELVYHGSAHHECLWGKYDFGIEKVKKGD